MRKEYRIKLHTIHAHSLYKYRATRGHFRKSRLQLNLTLSCVLLLWLYNCLIPITFMIYVHSRVKLVDKFCNRWVQFATDCLFIPFSLDIQRHPRVPVTILVEVNMKNETTNTTMERYGQWWGELETRHRTESAAAALGCAAHICSLYKDILRILPGS